MSRSETAEVARPHPGLLDWLTRHGVRHEVHEHPLTYTARETARAEGVEPRRFAKVVAVETAEGRRALVVVDATDQVDLVKARHVLGTGHVRLLSEAEMQELAPDCPPGTIPPVGALFGVTVYADHAVRDDPEIVFHAGSHRHTVHVDRAEWERAAGVVYGDLAVEREATPAWARS
jgi:Ala-tRNA(Pro) deacylase